MSTISSFKSIENKHDEDMKSYMKNYMKDYLKNFYESLREHAMKIINFTKKK